MQQQPPQPPADTAGEHVVAARMDLSRAWLAYVLFALNVIIFVVPWLLDLFTGSDAYILTLLLGQKDNEAIFNGEYYRLLTAMFLHGSPAHIIFNGWALISLGPETERFYGTLRFAVVYLIAGLAGSLASYALNTAPAVGASGAIFGLVGALLAFWQLARRVLGEAQSRAQLGSLITVLAINLFIGFSTPRIDNWAHLGGLVGGYLAGWLLAPRLVPDFTGMEPRIIRNYLPIGWPGAGALLALIGLIVALVRPPGV